jgi:hypothetical protein
MGQGCLESSHQRMQRGLTLVSSAATNHAGGSFLRQAPYLVPYHLWTPVHAFVENPGLMVFSPNNSKQFNELYFSTAVACLREIALKSGIDNAQATI